MTEADITSQQTPQASQGRATGRRAGVISTTLVALLFGVLPGALAVTVTVTPNRLNKAEPGGKFVYTVEVSNCDFGAMGCTITSLEDSVYGDLDGQGSCATGVDFTTTYTCSFSGDFFGDAGDQQTNEVTAEGHKQGDALMPFVDGEGSSMVTITESTRFSRRFGSLRERYSNRFRQSGRQSSRYSRD